jgi:DNA-directed RNA polymerase specialized sigma24 family protein
VANAIACAKQGTSSAVHFLYVRYADDARDYVESLVRDRKRGRGHRQDVFAELVAGSLRNAQREAPFAAWILGVARYSALDQLGSRRALPFEESHRRQVLGRGARPSPPRPGQPSRRAQRARSASPSGRAIGPRAPPTRSSVRRARSPSTWPPDRSPPPRGSRAPRARAAARPHSLTGCLRFEVLPHTRGERQLDPRAAALGPASRPRDPQRGRPVRAARSGSTRPRRRAAPRATSARASPPRRGSSSRSDRRPVSPSALTRRGGGPVGELAGHGGLAAASGKRWSVHRLGVPLSSPTRDRSGSWQRVARPGVANREVRKPNIVCSFLKSNSQKQDHTWRFVTNHAHVLQRISEDPTARLRDVAETVGITERAASQIVNDLEQAGYLTRTRVGRRNRYEVHEDLPLRHPQHRHHTVGELVRFLESRPSRRR